MTFYQRGELDLGNTQTQKRHIIVKHTHTTTHSLTLLMTKDMLVCDDRLLGAGFANHGKEVITIRNLLMHNAGFPPDPDPEYCNSKNTHALKYVTNNNIIIILLFFLAAVCFVFVGSREFACSSTLQPVPPETFDCRDRIYKALLQQTLENTPGEVFVYSDLSMVRPIKRVSRVYF